MRHVDARLIHRLSKSRAPSDDKRIKTRATLCVAPPSRPPCDDQRDCVDRPSSHRMISLARSHTYFSGGCSSSRFFHAAGEGIHCVGVRNAPRPCRGARGTCASLADVCMQLHTQHHVLLRIHMDFLTTAARVDLKFQSQFKAAGDRASAQAFAQLD